MRNALLEGARWWEAAFAAAGHSGGFKVEMMPDGADAMDVRYNVIQWVHRATRGWSYGASVTDPRTGEIIKGHVTLGSLRVRQDYLIAEGLLAPYDEDGLTPSAMQEMALARLRQLSAHEVGHTLGLAHNYVSSTQNRASVMDYPHPLVTVDSRGRLDLTGAYAVGVGEWDKVAIEYGYREFADEAAGLSKVLDAAHKRGLYFVSDDDARPAGSAHPQTHLWDNGVNAVAELERMLDVRRRALERFGDRSIRMGAPMATIEEALVPTYLLHRYQTEAASKVLGGLDYRYALRGDGQKVTAMVAGAEQRRSLEALLRTIQPETLALPERILKLIPPRPEGYDAHREMFARRTGVTFDPLAAAESAAGITVTLLLHPERAARLVEYHARDAQLPGLEEVIQKVLVETWMKPRVSGLGAEVQRVVDRVVLNRLLGLAALQAGAYAKTGELERWIEKRIAAEADARQKAHLAQTLDLLKRWRTDPKSVVLPAVLEAPPGQPI